MFRNIMLAFLFLPTLVFGKEVAIVGGGLAGLTAAYELSKDKGLNVQVYEAKDRPGGRVFTVLVDGKPAELGGENINDAGPAPQIRRVVKELGLKIAKRERKAAETFFFDPETKATYTVNDLIPYFPKMSGEELQAKLKVLEKDAANLQQVIDRFFSEFKLQGETQIKVGVIRRMVIESVRSFEGDDPANLSPRYAHGSLPWMIGRFLKKRTSDPEPIDSVAGGNSQLVLALARRLGDRLHLNSPLIEINRIERGGYELKMRGQEKAVHADLVILALPAKPYSNIKFGAGTLEPERIQKIVQIGYGTQGKVLVPSPTPVKPALVFTPGTMVWRRNDETWNTIYLNGIAGVVRDGKEATSRFEAANSIMPAELKMDLGGTLHTPEKILAPASGPLFISWTLDPYIMGGYSHYRSDTRETLEKIVKVKGVEVPALFVPVNDSIFFAGEHTTVDPDARGTMEAAVASGVSAAKLLGKAVK